MVTPVKLKRNSPKNDFRAAGFTDAAVTPKVLQVRNRRHIYEASHVRPID
jgi:hypothetical protein